MLHPLVNGDKADRPPLSAEQLTNEFSEALPPLGREKTVPRHLRGPAAILFISRDLVARPIRNAIRANRFARIDSQLKPLFLQCVRPIRTNPSNSDSRESRH